MVVMWRGGCVHRMFVCGVCMFRYVHPVCMCVQTPRVCVCSKCVVCVEEDRETTSQETEREDRTNGEREVSET